MHSVEMFDPEHTVKMILIKGNDLVNTAQLRGKKKSLMITGRINITFWKELSPYFCYIKHKG